VVELDPEILIVGGIASVRNRLELLGKPKTGEEIDYPASLSEFNKRRIWTSTIGQISTDSSMWGVFVKPKVYTKSFAGRIINSYKDLIGLQDTDLEIWCSEVVEFKTEWRCFIRYGEVLDVRQYKGAWDSRIDPGVVYAAVKAFKGAPAAYVLDFGIDAGGTMRLVEVNDGHSLGSYGIGAVSYAKFLSARWAEMTGTKDYAKF
jgi:hypothetical protein